MPRYILSHVLALMSISTFKIDVILYIYYFSYFKLAMVPLRIDMIMPISVSVWYAPTLRMCDTCNTQYMSF
jgi:hypothetical protein